jgi:Mg-chelatase subunit ChlD
VCIKQYGYPPSEDRGVWDPDTGPDAAWTWCFSPIITAIDGMDSAGNTNIAGGLEQGMAVLSTGSGHYGRPAAAKVIVLMTDGQANVSPSGPCDDDSSLWPDGGAPKDCVIYFANQAQDRNIVVYTIGLGDSADHSLLRAVADRTGGVYYFAPDPDRLDAIFQQIADQIFLRLVQ